MRIAATVWASWGSQNDWLDLYAAPDVNNPVWTHIATLNPGFRGQRSLSTAWTLPSAGRQVIRGIFRYYWAPNPPCSPGAYNDVDDLVIDVQ